MRYFSAQHRSFAAQNCGFLHYYVYVNDTALLANGNTTLDVHVQLKRTLQRVRNRWFARNELSINCLLALSSSSRKSSWCDNGNDNFIIVTLVIDLCVCVCVRTRARVCVCARNISYRYHEENLESPVKTHI